MKSRIYLSLITVFISVFSSCSKEEKSYTRQELQDAADSILDVALKDLHRQAREDLDRRLPIELKPKVDSILKISYEVPAPPQIEGAAAGEEDSAAAQPWKIK